MLFYLFLFKFDSFGVCLNNSCTAGYALRNGSCDACIVSNCATCNNVTLKCIECKTNYNFFFGSCIPCIPFYYFNKTLSKCLPCLAGCSNCENNYSCLNCKDGYMKIFDDKNQLLCNTNCLDGFYKFELACISNKTKLFII